MVKKNSKAMVKKVKKVTDVEKILGEKEEFKTVEVFDYDNEKTKYKVTNYKNNGRVVYVNGREVEAFIGLNNDAREQLKAGTRVVKVYDSFAADELLYKIEVL